MKLIITVLLLFATSIIFCQSPAPSQPVIKALGNDWFEVTASVAIENITPEEAKNLAIRRACKQAIEFYCGVEISGRVLSVQAESDDAVLMDNFLQLINQTSNGIILEKEILNEETKTEGNVLKKVIVLKVKVGKQKGGKDPYFNLDASLNRVHFKEKEKLEITVTPSLNCYLTIFNICSNDSVYIIFPNQFKKDNLVREGETLKLPDENDIKKGVSFPVYLLPGKKEDSEIIKIIATKKPLIFTSFQSFSTYGTFQSALDKLLVQIMKIPRNEIEEADLQYFIHK
ncbi:MAG: DUF4384 domain-containing protein [Armatimonadetes bacterium]|nr:DUF4384 domain-containing protein [Armatimonadota bacterium]